MKSTWIRVYQYNPSDGSRYHAMRWKRLPYNLFGIRTQERIDGLYAERELSSEEISELAAAQSLIAYMERKLRED